jgi:hypothetical protein
MMKISDSLDTISINIQKLDHRLLNTESFIDSY